MERQRCSLESGGYVAAAGGNLRLQLPMQVASQEVAAMRRRLAGHHGSKDVRPCSRCDGLQVGRGNKSSTRCHTDIIL